MALKKGISNVVATILLLVITIALTGAAYMLISGILTSKSTILSVLSEMCKDGNITLFVKNEGVKVIKSSDITIVHETGSCTGEVVPDIEPGQTSKIILTNCTTGRHVIHIITSGGGIPPVPVDC